MTKRHKRTPNLSDAQVAALVGNVSDPGYTECRTWCVNLATAFRTGDDHEVRDLKDP